MPHPERIVSDRAEQLAILGQCIVGRLGMIDEEGCPYVLPMNFGWEDDGTTLHIYLHCAHEGRKLRLLAQNPNVCFEADCGHEVVENEFACAYTLKYQSVIATGKAVLVTEVPEKIHALTLFMKQQTGKDFVFEEKHTRAVEILRLDMDHISGKRRYKK